MAGTYSNLLVHVIFSTKNRAPVLTGDLRERLYRYIGGIVRAEECDLLEIGGVEDHVHLLLQIRPRISVAEIVRLIKTNSSKWVNESGVVGGFRWQTGYGVFSVSESRAADVRRYIRRQEEHHRRVSFRDEIAGFLTAHGVEFEDRFLPS